MRTVILRPGDVALAGPAVGLFPHPTSIVVGFDSQWADGSDATYAKISSDSSSAPAYLGSDTAYAPMPTLAESGVTPTTVIGAELHLRASALVSSGVGPYLTDAAYPADQTVAAFADDVYTPTGGGLVEEFSSTFSDVAGVVAALTVASPVIFITTPGTGSDLTVYELWVVLTTTGTPTTPPLRQSPRNDGLGTSSAPRLYPPPRSVQASNRRAGGYL